MNTLLAYRENRLWELSLFISLEDLQSFQKKEVGTYEDQPVNKENSALRGFILGIINHDEMKRFVDIENEIKTDKNEFLDFFDEAFFPFFSNYQRLTSDRARLFAMHRNQCRFLVDGVIQNVAPVGNKWYEKILDDYKENYTNIAKFFEKPEYKQHNRKRLFSLLLADVAEGDNGTRIGAGLNLTAVTQRPAVLYRTKVVPQKGWDYISEKEHSGKEGVITEEKSCLPMGETLFLTPYGLKWRGILRINPDPSIEDIYHFGTVPVKGMQMPVVFEKWRYDFDLEKRCVFRVGDKPELIRNDIFEKYGLTF